MLISQRFPSDISMNRSNAGLFRRPLKNARLLPDTKPRLQGLNICWCWHSGGVSGQIFRVYI